MRENLVAWVVALGAVIFFHELGHFLVAKLAGIYVKTFSIGFGPKLLKFRLGETQYALSAVPFGGYVRMAGENAGEIPPPPAETAPEAGTAAPVGERVLTGRDETADREIPLHRHLNRKPIPTRLAVVTAGPFANLLLAMLVMTGVAYQQGLRMPPTTTIGELAAEGDEAAAGLQSGDRIAAIAGTPVANPLDIQRTLEALPAGPFDMRVQRAGRDTTLAFPAVRRDAEGIIFPAWRYSLDTRVGRVKKDGPAWKAGLRRGDRIVSVDGEPIASWDEFAERINPAIGRSLQVVWDRGGEPHSASIAPEADEVPDEARPGKVKKIGRIQLEPYNERHPISPAQAVGSGLRSSWGFAVETGRFLWTLLQGKGSRDAVGGPIRVGSMAASMLRWGWADLLLFIAYFSVNLFLLNLLPIPVLDGGHVLFLVIEAVRGEALSTRVQEAFLKVGVSALLALMGYVVVMDVWWLLNR